MKLTTLLFTLLFSFTAFALKRGDVVPPFSLSDQTGQMVHSEDFANKWTVLFFYPKADTPGCTKQACAFRDNAKKFKEMGVDIYGISVNSVKDQKKFAEKYNLSFPLLADEEAKVAKLFDVKRPIINIAKRWTFIIAPDKTIVDIGEDVDPVLDSQRVMDKIEELKKSYQSSMQR